MRAAANLHPDRDPVSAECQGLGCQPAYSKCQGSGRLPPCAAQSGWTQPYVEPWLTSHSCSGGAEPLDPAAEVDRDAPAVVGRAGEGGEARLGLVHALLEVARPVGVGDAELGAQSSAAYSALSIRNATAASHRRDWVPPVRGRAQRRVRDGAVDERAAVGERGRREDRHRVDAEPVEPQLEVQVRVRWSCRGSRRCRSRSPAETVWPSVTSTVSMWAYRVSTPPPWSMRTSVPAQSTRLEGDDAVGGGVDRRAGRRGEVLAGVRPGRPERRRCRRSRRTSSTSRRRRGSAAGRASSSRRRLASSTRPQLAAAGTARIALAGQRGAAGAVHLARRDAAYGDVAGLRVGGDDEVVAEVDAGAGEAGLVAAEHDEVADLQLRLRGRGAARATGRASRRAR